MTLLATVGPENATNKALEWISTDPEVADVDQNGKVTAKTQGTTDIIAKATDGSGVFAPCTVTVTKVYVLEEPSILSLTNMVSGMKITWDKVSDADGYILYRKQSGDTEYKVLKKISGASAGSYIDKSVVSGRTYYYRVAAYSGDRESTLSEYVKKTFVGTTKISSAVNSEKGIVLTWKRINGATKYEIYRKISRSNTFHKVKTITSGSIVQWTDTKATANGKTYQYYIVASKGSVRGANSASVKNVFVTRPVIGKLTEKAGAKLLLQWKRNSAANGYQIQYGTNSNMSGTQNVYVNDNKTVSMTFSSLKKGRKYYVRIRTYKIVSGKKYYSAWSQQSALLIKK